MIAALFASRKLIAFALGAVLVAGSVAYVAHLRSQVATFAAERAEAERQLDTARRINAQLWEANIRAARDRLAADAAVAAEAAAAGRDRAGYRAAARAVQGAPVAEDGPLAGVLRDGLGRLRELAGARAGGEGDPAADGPADAAGVPAGADAP